MYTPSTVLQSMQLRLRGRKPYYYSNFNNCLFRPAQVCIAVTKTRRERDYTRTGAFRHLFRGTARTTTTQQQFRQLQLLLSTKRSGVSPRITPPRDVCLSQSLPKILTQFFGTSQHPRLVRPGHGQRTGSSGSGSAYIVVMPSS